MIFPSKRNVAEICRSCNNPRMDTKICNLCERILPASDFYKGLRQCKDCYKAKVKKYRRDNRKKILEYDKQRSKLTHRVEARRAYAKTPEGKIAHYRANKKWRDADRRRDKCHNAVAKALMRGKLERQCCEQCGADVAEAHHNNYDEPLNVRWLCQSCHTKWHQENKVF